MSDLGAASRCPLCGGSLAGEYRVREMMLGLRDEFHYGECTACGSLVLKDPPADLASYYPSDYYSLRPRSRPRAVIRIAKRMRAETAARGLRRVSAAIGLGAGAPGWMTWLEMSGLDRTASICDLGTGRGDGLLDLRDDGFTDLIGADPFIDESTVREGIKLEKATAGEMTGTYDLVMFNHSFEHVLEPLATLRAARNLLAPGGTLMLRTPVAGCWAWRHYGADWVALDAPRHQFVPSESGLHAAAEATGLTVHNIVYDSTEMQFWRSEQYRRDIPLFDPESHQTDPAASAFTPAQMRAWRRQAKVLNEARDGDTVATFMRVGDG